MSGLWGAIPNAPEGDSGIAELEELTRPQAIEPEAPLLFQPSSRHCPPSNEPLPARWFQMDPVVLHTIRLLDHARKTRHAIATITHNNQEGRYGEHNVPSVPPIPEYDGPALKHTTRPPLNHMPVDMDSDFVNGKGERIPDIDEVTNRILLRRSVAAILSHASFEGSTSQVLETLTDVTNEFYLQFMAHLRAAADYAAHNGQLGFPDLIERVFQEMNVGSVSSLHDFYQSQVLDYQRRTLATCRSLLADLDKLRQPSALTTHTPSTSTTPASKDTFNVIRIKEEPSADLQIPVLGEGVSEAEQLLQLEGLSNFEITVEHETTGGLTTDVESKWPQSVKAEQDKAKSVESGDEPVNVTDTSGSVGGQDSVPPHTPRTPREPPGSIEPSQGDASQGPGSVSAPVAPSPLSPPRSAGPSKAKKRKP